jgi:DNA phosphorothioation-dependent restriction protein DptG
MENEQGYTKFMYVWQLMVKMSQWFVEDTLS